MNQSKLVQLLSDALADKRVVSLVHRFLMAGVAVDGVVEGTPEGTPQGPALAALTTAPCSRSRAISRFRLASSARARRYIAAKARTAGGTV